MATKNLIRATGAAVVAAGAATIIGALVISRRRPTIALPIGQVGELIQAPPALPRGADPMTAAPAVQLVLQPLPAPPLVLQPPPAAPAAPAAPPAASTGPDFSGEAFLIASDAVQPGTSASYYLIKAALQRYAPAVVGAISRYKSRYGDYLRQLAQAGIVSQQNAAKARGDLEALQAGDAISNGVQAVPIVGQILSGLWKIARQFVQLAAEATAQGYSPYGANWTAGGAPGFSGFKDGDFYFCDVPVLSLTSPIWAANFPQNPPGSWDNRLKSFVALASFLPFGYGVTPITIQTDGAYSYTFQNQGARTFEVWNPADITPSGPRGFNPAQPWAWKANGAKSSVYDLPASVAGPPGGSNQPPPPTSASTLIFRSKTGGL